MSLELLRDHLNDGDSALDIGSGSGYLTVCMSLMVSFVFFHSSANYVRKFTRICALSARSFLMGKQSGVDFAAAFCTDA